MCSPDEKFFTPLTPSEYRLLDILCTLSNKSVCNASMEELARFAQCSEESVRRALRGLEAANLITTLRTKRNLGRLHKNVYTLVSPSHKNVDEGVVIHKNEDAVVHKIVGSTAVTGNTSNLTTRRLNKTTSYLGADARKKRKKVSVVNSWKDDDNVGGFGLFDEEVVAKTAGPKPSKRKPNTRHQRPRHEWTVPDVIAEFTNRVSNVMPDIRNPVNFGQLLGQLHKMRRENDIDALIELEILELFFEDSWLKTKGRQTPQYITGRYLQMFKSHLDIALKRLGLPERDSLTERDVHYTSPEQVVYASDGTAFDNSMPGRLELKEYEEELRKKVNG